MTFKVLYNGEKYELQYSMRVLSEYQDDSMKCESIPTLSHLKLIRISTKKNPDLNYKLFVGVMPTKYNTIIIIYGEYFENRPYQCGLFHYIEVPKSEMIEFDEQPSNFILDVGDNSCAILFKRGAIVIGITPDFYGHLDDFEVDKRDELEYREPYLSIHHIYFIRKITELLFDGPPSIDKKMTLSVEKYEDHCEICLCFPFVCRDSSGEIQSETTDKITICISDEEIEIFYVMNRITACHVVDSAFSDLHKIQTREENDILYLKITYDRFPEEDD
jgi:hypothetical protein